MRNAPVLENEPLEFELGARLCRFGGGGGGGSNVAYVHLGLKVPFQRMVEGIRSVAEPTTVFLCWIGGVG
jgi:hypothetical protein